MALNASEQFVEEIAGRAFLRLWTYPNPLGKAAGKELCDLLIVCDPDIVVISVKEVAVPPSGDMATDLARWQRRAIDKSCRQLYGAERQLEAMDAVVRSDGTLGLPLPAKADRRMHRVAVAIGGEGRFPIEFGDAGKGFVHVMDATSVRLLLSELDTVRDVVDYLVNKEACFTKAEARIVGGEEDLLALYLQNGRAFPDADLLVTGDDLWRPFASSPEYQQRLNDDRISYAWDDLLNSIGGEVDKARGPEALFLDTEAVARTMARESRFDRRVLAAALVQHVREASTRPEPLFRTILRKGCDVAYVFLAASTTPDTETCQAELLGRCHIALGQARDNGIAATTAIGVAIPGIGRGETTRYDALYYRIDDWGAEEQAAYEDLLASRALAPDPKVTALTAHEYTKPKLSDSD